VPGARGSGLEVLKATSTQRAGEIEALVQRHQGSVRGFLVFLGCPRERIDDLVQDVFVSVLSAGFEHKGDASTTVFLRKVTRHLFLKTMQRERRMIAIPDLVLAERAWIGFERDDGGRGYLEALRACLERVHGRAARALDLRYRAGRPLEAIARELGVREAGVKSMLVRARRALRECIERRLAS
jgi:RNA polymerase sigma-70 factor (ECF subfamily)